MSRIIDSEEVETQVLKDNVEWGRREVLEIGCGEGRLARRLAGLNATVTAIDPFADLVKTALDTSSGVSERGIRYCVGDGVRLPFAREVFDVVLFGWSL